MKTTINEVMKFSPCTSGIKNLIRQVGADYDKDKPIDVASLVGGENVLSDITWLLAKMGEKNILIELAIYSAELVLHIYEKNNSSGAPRKAIEAAKACLKNPSEENKERCRSGRRAAAAAADAAAYAAAAAADAAAYAAAAAAAAAADADAYAAAAAAAAAYADAAYAADADAAYAARKEIQGKINAKLIELLS